MAMRVYRSGLHYGEEKIVAGNDRSGMILFSGCHLACSFCYTPEVSFKSMGTVTEADAFESLVDSLVDRGAKNINLVSPTHVLNSLVTPLTHIRRKYGRTLPIVFKTSGYEPFNVIKQMVELGDVFVPDFKLFSPEACRLVRLPADYGRMAAASVAELTRRLGEPQYNHERRLSRGVVVRHLYMPGFEKESEWVVGALQRIGYSGGINFMTHFVNPETRRLEQAPTHWIDLVTGLADSAGMQPLVDGKLRQEVAYGIR